MRRYVEQMTNDKGPPVCVLRAVAVKRGLIGSNSDWGRGR